MKLSGESVYLIIRPPILHTYKRRSKNGIRLAKTYKNVAGKEDLRSLTTNIMVILKIFLVSKDLCLYMKYDRVYSID